MTKKSAARLAKDGVVQVSQAKRRELLSLREAAKVAGMRFDTAVAEAFHELKMPIETSVVCLDCGTVRLADANGNQCRVCNPPAEKV